MVVVRRVGAGKVYRSVFTGCLAGALSLFAAITTSAQAGGAPVRPPSAALSWGYNGVGETGQGTASFAAPPGYVSRITQFTALAAGNSHTIGIDASGGAHVWTWGFNNVGQLGPIAGDQREPTFVPMPRRVLSVAAGGWHSLALLEDGTVWAWGYNSVGQLGDGTFSNRPAPMRVSGLSGVVAIAAGAYHSLALKSDGTIWGWGWGGRGQLGPSGGGPLPRQILVPWRVTAIAAGTGEGDFTIALASDGMVYAWGANNFCQTGACGADVFQPRAVLGLPAAVAIGAGDYHAAAITTDGRLFTWGSNLYGQLGAGTIGSTSGVPVEAGISGAIEVDGGARHTIVRTPSGVYVAGENRVLQHGAAGPDTTSWTLVPGTDAGSWGQVVAGGYHSYALRAFSAQLKAPSVPLGSFPVNAETVAVSFDVENIGTDPVELGTAALFTDMDQDGSFETAGNSAVYAVTADGCTGRTIAPGAICSMRVEMRPVIVGTFVARVQFSGATIAPAVPAIAEARLTAIVTDPVPPSIVLLAPTEGALYPAGTPILADYSCRDNWGLASCQGTTPVLQPLDMTVGAHSFTATAVDNQGLTTTRTVTYTVTAKAIDFTWTPIAGDGPSARSAHKLVYDTRRAKVVLFGGQDATGAFLNDVWEFDPSARTWTNVTPPAGSPAPIPRAQFGMAYDEARDKVVVYGGAVSTDVSNVGITGSTWEWDPASRSWSEKVNASTIVFAGLFGAELAYDPVSRQVILFGGQPYWGFPENGTTYGWNGTTWVERSTRGPLSRIRHAMWTDPVGGRVLMHGGHSIYPESRYFDDLWEWDGIRWQYVAEFPGADVEQNSPAVVFDAVRGASVLFGGAVTDVTKAWTASGWTTLTPALAPSARTTAMAYAASTGEIVLFGGNTTRVPSDSTQGSFSAGAQGDTWIGRTRLRHHVGVTITPEPAIVPYGEPVSVTARLDTEEGVAVANAVVTVTSVLGERRVAMTDADGIALVQLNTTGLKTGVHSAFVTVEYAGDDQNVASSATATLQISDPTPPTIAITSPISTYRVGEVVLAQYTCGDVESEVVECVGTVPVGAPVDTRSAGVKRFQVRATSGFRVSVIQFVDYAVVQAATSTTLSMASQRPARFGQVLQWHAAVRAQDGTAPLGNVLFLEDGAQIASIPLNADGAATLLRVARPNHTIVARYAGDDTYLTSDSLPLVAEVVTPTGQLRAAGVIGNGTTSSSYTLQRVAGFDDVAMVAAGALHALALRADGTVWAWGSNWGGQLGREGGDALVPVQVPGLENIVALAAGEAYSLALRADGAVLAWGFNGNGELGSGAAFPEHNSTPQVVPGLPFVSALAAGANHAIALTADGHVWGWGLTANYQLATNVFKSYSAIQLPIAGVVGIAAGDHHSVALKSDGSVWTVGEGEWGQYGNGTSTAGTVFVRATIADVTAIAAGEKHTVALERDGTVWVWGHAPYGQLGDGTRRQVNLPVQVSNLTGVVAIAATANANSSSRDSHNLAVKADGTLWAWGPNFYGQFGVGTASEAVTRPVQIPVRDVSAFDAGTRFTVSVGARSETTSLRLDAAEVPYGSPLTLVATLTAPTGPVPGAVIRFDVRGDGTHDDATATTDAEGRATVTLSWSTVAALGVGTIGTHAFGAQFSADAIYEFSSATGGFTVVKASVPLTLINVDQVYDGTPKTVAVTGAPSGSTVEISYDGSAQPPVDAGTYPLSATLVSDQYMATATGTLTIRKAPVAITWGDDARVVSAGSMTRVRRSHAAVVLTDGRVLLAGSDGFDRSAETFDPSIATFARTGDLTTGRCYGCAAALLPDGRVLVAGGWNGGAVLDTAEVFDPATGQFALLSARMIANRLGPNAVVLSDGRILISGGHDGSSIYASAEIFDPVTMTFAPTGSMGAPRLGPAVRLPDGRVLVAGGMTSTGSYLASAEIYDPQTGRWSSTGSMAIGRHGHAVTMLKDGRVLVTGGIDNASRQPTSVAEIFDPAASTFTRIGDMTSAKSGHAVVALPTGEALVIGGSTSSAGAVPDVDLFDPATETFRAGPPLAIARASAAAVLLKDGRTLVTGGNGANGSSLSSAEIYEPGGLSPIVYGTPLGAAQLSATATIPGSFVYDPPGGTILGGGAHTLSATFAPADVANYESSRISRTITVTRARATLLATGGSFIYDGRPHGALVIATGLLEEPLTPITITYNGTAAEPLTAGTYTVTGSFPGDANYEAASVTATITIAKATPTIAWTPPAPIVFGTPLSNVQLNATSDVPGTFFYPFPAGLVFGGGMATLTTTFTPADQANYTTADARVSLEVLRAALSLGPVTASRASAEIGEGVTFAATMENVPAFAVPLVEFFADGTSIGRDASSASRVAVTHAFSQAGSVAITARFAGNANYLPADAPAGVEVTIAPSSRHYKIATIANGAFTNAIGINSSGMIAGTGVDPATGVVGGLVYDRGIVTPLGTIDGASLRPSVLNDQGFVAGTFTAAGVERVFVWRAGVATDLGTPNAASSSLFVHGVNASGEVAGSFSVPTGSSSTARAFAYLDGVMRDVSVSSSFFNVARAIFDDGTVVVNDRNVLYLRSRSGAVTPMGTPGGATADISASHGDGTAVGTGAAANGALVAFIYRAGTFDVVGPFQETLIPTSVSAGGNLAGVHRWGNAASFRPAAVVNGMLLDLASFAPPDSGWVLKLTGGVTDRGVVVGSGTLGGQTRAFIALPREATALVAARGEGIYGGVASLEATLVAGDRAVGGRTLEFSVDGRAVGTGVTDASGTARVAGVSLAGLAAGTYPLRIAFAGDDEYVDSDVAAWLTVARATAAVRVTGGTFTYDGQPHGAVATATGVNGETLTTVSVTYNGSSETPVDAGTYAVVVTFAGDDNYEAAMGRGTLVVDSAPLRVIAKDASRRYGDANPPLGAIYEGFVNGEGVDVLLGTLTVSTAAVASSHPGGYLISASGLTSNNYAIEYVAGTLTIVKATLPTTFVIGGTFTFDGRPHPATVDLEGVFGEDLSPRVGVSYHPGGSAPVSAGSYSVGAAFMGDDDYDPTLDASARIVILPAATSTLSTAPAMAVFGEPVPVGVVVGANAIVGVDGAASVLVDGTLAGVAPLAASVNPASSGQFVVTGLTIGTHTITVVYPGSANFAGSSAGALTVTVNRASTAIVLTASPEPSGAGEPVLLSANVTPVAPGAGAPGGTVEFLDNGVALGSALVSLVDGSYVATLTSSGLAAGEHSLTAEYGGDARFAGSSAATSHTVNSPKASTTTTMHVPASAAAGAQVIFDAVVGAASGSADPTGVVEFVEGATVLGSAALQLSKGAMHATLTLSFATAGSHEVVARYLPDGSMSASASTPATVTIYDPAEGAPVGTTTDIAASKRISFGDPLTVTIAVRPGTPPKTTPLTGTVEIFVDNRRAAQASVSGQSASVTLIGLSVGAHEIVAVFTSDSVDYSGSTSKAAIVTVR